MTPLHIAVIGATSLEGRSVLTLLHDRDFPISRISAVDLAQYHGETSPYGNLELDILSLEDFDFTPVDLVFFAVPKRLSSQLLATYKSALLAAHCHVIVLGDDTAASLVLPNTHAATLSLPTESPQFLTVPASELAPLARALSPFLSNPTLHIQHIGVASYQAVSGIGQEGIDELVAQTSGLFAQQDFDTVYFPQRIAFNALPQNGLSLSHDPTPTEALIENGLRQLYQQPDLSVLATCVTVPLFFGYAWVVNLVLESALSLDSVETLIKTHAATLGLSRIEDDALSLVDVVSQDRIWITRVRTSGKAVTLTILADNILAGAAYSAVQVAETLLPQLCAKTH